MTYFHIGDLVKSPSLDKHTFAQYYKITASFKNRLVREFKNNAGKGRAFPKLLNLIDTTEFINLEEADRNIKWEEKKVVSL